MRILLAEKITDQGCMRCLQNSPVVVSLRSCHSAKEALEAIISAPENFDLVAIDHD